MTQETFASAEGQRQAELDRLEILDTPSEVFTDSVAAAAACVANVPMAALSFIDRDRQWRKSGCGLVGADIPRSVSVCAHAIMASEPLVVDDLSADARFCDNPFVVGAPYARFYAGFSIVVGGQPVGALCVIDDRPRTLSAVQLAKLQGLSAHVAVWLDERAHR